MKFITHLTLINPCIKSPSISEVYDLCPYFKVSPEHKLKKQTLAFKHCISLKKWPPVGSLRETRWGHQLPTDARFSAVSLGVLVLIRFH